MGEVLSGPLSERRDVSAARVRPAPRPCLPPRGFERMGVAFSLVTFFWRPKESHPPGGTGCQIIVRAADLLRATEARPGIRTWATTRDARRRALSSFIQQASASALLQIGRAHV